jgi:hypothetical protein
MSSSYDLTMTAQQLEAGGANAQNLAHSEILTSTFGLASLALSRLNINSSMQLFTPALTIANQELTSQPVVSQLNQPWSQAQPNIQVSPRETNTTPPIVSAHYIPGWFTRAETEEEILKAVDLSCMICLTREATEPMFLSCLHTICRDCASRSCDESTTLVRCPNPGCDRETAVIDFVPNLIAEEVMSNCSAHCLVDAAWSCVSYQTHVSSLFCRARLIGISSESRTQCDCSSSNSSCTSLLRA